MYSEKYNNNNTTEQRQNIKIKKRLQIVHSNASTNLFKLQQETMGC